MADKLSKRYAEAWKLACQAFTEFLGEVQDSERYPDHVLVLLRRIDELAVLYGDPNKGVPYETIGTSEDRHILGCQCWSCSADREIELRAHPDAAD